MAKLGLGNSGGLLKGRWTIWGLALFFALLAAFGVFTIIGKSADQVTYYVIKAPVAARTLITPDMLMPISTNASGVPPTALGLNIFGNNAQLYTRIPLKAGDVISSSVVGKWQSLTANLPAGFLISSIKVAPEDAAGGRIKAGDYIDIAAVSTGGKASAKIILHHVLVLDVTVAPSTVAAAANANSLNQSGTGPDSPALYSGIPQLYTLAVSAQDFTTLGLVRSSNLYLGLSSNDAAGNTITGYADSTTIFAPGAVSDAGSGTDNVFAVPTPSATPTK